MSDKNKVFAKNFNKFYISSGLDQQAIADYLGVSRSTISTWLLGKRFPRIEVLNKIADFFGVSVAELLYDESEEDARVDILGNKVVEIPVYKAVKCGVPNMADNQIIGFEEIPVKWAKSGSYFGVKCSGNSMSPNFLDGDILIVKQQNTANNGDIVIVRINGDDACCRKFTKTSDGFVLTAANPAYDPLPYTIKEIRDIPVEIIGVVVEMRRKL